MTTTAAVRGTAAPPSTLRPTADPRPPLKIHSLAIVADRALITGTHPVEIGENTIIHPHARIIATTGRVIIGKNCTVSEKATISASEGKGQDCVLGEGVNVEGDAVLEGCSVGDWSVVEVGARVERMGVVGRWCKVGVREVVLPGEKLEDYTVVFGENERRVDRSVRDFEEVRSAKEKGQIMMCELLRKLIADGSKWRT